MAASGPRYLISTIREDAIASGKMAFVSGPRQVGKTTLAKALLASPQNYQTWDDTDFRRAWSRSPRLALDARGPGPMVLDEIHKDRRWKTRLKGVFDVAGAGDGMIVTGSARMDLHRRGGDSLMGRFLPYRLHPFSVAETAAPPGPDQILMVTEPHQRFADLLRLGGFPEPFLGGSQAKAVRWSRLRLDRLLAEDVRDLRAVEDLSGLRVLADLLPERVGSLLSVNALREDVGAAYATVRSWVKVFEALYHCFLIAPYAKRIARAIQTAPKLYLFDILRIPPAHEAARLENLTALHLLKACHFWTDSAQGDFELRFVRDKEGREVDFLVLRDGRPWLLVECKSNDIDPSPALDHFARQLGVSRAFQLVTKPGYDRVYTQKNVRVVSYERFLAGWI
ncbi:MAG: AAA family ATPase [Pseudomonadota bacterium]